MKNVTHTEFRQSSMTPSLIAAVFTVFLVLIAFGGDTFAQGVNYPVGSPTGTSGTGNARTDPDNLFLRNNVAGMTEIAVDAAEENTGKLNDAGKGAWRLFGELQVSRYTYQRSRPYVGTPGVGITSTTSLYAPGATAEVTYTAGNHKYAFGVGTYTIFGFQSKIGDDPNKLGPRALFFDSRVASNDLAFGAAARANKHFSIGGSFIVGRAFVDIKAPTAELLVRGIVSDSRLDVTDFGAPGFSVGVHIRPTERVAFGFNYKSKRTYNLEGTLTATALVTTPQGPRLVPIKPDVNVEFKLPQVAEVGVRVKATEKLALLTDYRFYNYADALKTVNVKDAASGRVLTGLTINAKNVHSVRAGAVYNWSDNTKLNAGFAFTSDGFRDRLLNPGLINTGGFDVSGAIHKRVLGQWVNFSVAGIIGRDRNVYPQINPPFNGVYSGRGILFGVGIRLRS